MKVLGSLCLFNVHYIIEGYNSQEYAIRIGYRQSNPVVVLENADR